MLSRRRRKRIKRWLVFSAGRIAALPLFLLPLSVALFLGRRFGDLAYAVAGRDRRRAIQQIESSLALPAPQARTLARRSFQHLGQIAIEILLLPRIRPRFERYVTFSDADRSLLATVSAEKKGVIFVTGHVGNFELLAQRVVGAGFPGVTLARSAPNPYLGAWLVERRRQGGLDTINRGEDKAARKLLGALRDGKLIGVLMDQDTKVDSIHVPFFGRPAATPIAAAQLAHRKAVPIVLGFIQRNADGSGHTIRLERPSLPPLESTAADAWIHEVTALLTARIEAAIRAQPNEWVWVHERWKTPPADG